MPGEIMKPTCRECLEGKHSACDGNTWFEIKDDLLYIECECSLNNHYYRGQD